MNVNQSVYNTPEAPKLTPEQLEALLATKPLTDEDIVGYVSTDDADETEDLKVN